MSNLVIRCYDGGSWKELIGFREEMLAVKMAESLIETGYRKVKVISDDKEIASFGNRERYNALIKKCKEKLSNYDGVSDLIEASDTLNILKEMHIVSFEIYNKMLNAIAEYNIEERDTAQMDINEIKASLNDCKYDIEDALYHLTYWKSIDDLKKASEIMTVCGLDPTEVDLSTNYLKENSSDRNILIKDTERALISIGKAIESIEIEIKKNIEDPIYGESSQDYQK